MLASMRVVLSPDKFKGSLTAAQVAEAVAAGLVNVRPDVDITLLPVADGGDGTVDAAVSAGFERVSVESVGPTGRPVTAMYALRGPRAVVELANVVGLDRLPGGALHPLTASTHGLGLMVLAALERGAQEIILGLGGSASTDGGAGMLQALGARVRDADGEELAPGGGALEGVESLDLRLVHERLAGRRILVASDVDNPLLGETGAAQVFGPQKGARTAELVILEQGLLRWSQVVAAVTGADQSASPGAGAAGGTAFAAVAVLGATIRPGIELILDLVGFANAVPGADLVITGEGSLDQQSLAGKAPVGVSRAASLVGVPVVAVAGRLTLGADELASAGISRAYPLSDLEPDMAVSMADAGPLLTTTGERIARDWLS